MENIIRGMNSYQMDYIEKDAARHTCVKAERALKWFKTPPYAMTHPAPKKKEHENDTV